MTDHDDPRGPEAFRRHHDPDTSHEAIARYEPKRDTARGRVLDYLRQHHGEWIDAPTFTDPDIGGFGGTRRLRELREAGWPIETRPKPGATNTWQHRLVDEPPEEGMAWVPALRPGPDGPTLVDRTWALDDTPLPPPRDQETLF